MWVDDVEKKDSIVKGRKKKEKQCKKKKKAKYARSKKKGEDCCLFWSRERENRQKGEEVTREIRQTFEREGTTVQGQGTGFLFVCAGRRPMFRCQQKRDREDCGNENEK